MTNKTRENQTISALMLVMITALKKKVIDFPVLRRDVTNQTLTGRELLSYSRPGRDWVKDIPAGDGNVH
jgi:hypothetical protein